MTYERHGVNMREKKEVQVVLVTLNKKLKVLFCASLLAFELKSRTHVFYSVPKAQTFTIMIFFSCDIHTGRELQIRQQGLYSIPFYLWFPPFLSKTLTAFILSISYLDHLG